MLLQRAFIRHDEPVRAHTSFRIGGLAWFWADVRSTASLREALEFAENARLPIFVIGGGSNILVKDDGFKGMVIRLCGEAFKGIEFAGEVAEVGAGASLGRLCKKSAEAGLAGFEQFYGIPGTLGGAIAGNAGSGQRSEGRSHMAEGIGELVEEVKVMDYSGNIKTLTKEDLKFGYRSSNLRDCIILKARLKLREDASMDIMKRMEAGFVHKKLTQDLSSASAGCIFKNPNGRSAAEVIDALGMKGKSMGDAVVSPKHANFIINRGTATAGDVLGLISWIKESAKERLGIELELEIKVVG